MSLTRSIRAEIDKASRKLAGGIRRALISVAPTSGFFMSAKGLTGEIWTDLELWQQYGVASRPPANGEVMVVRPDSTGGEGAVAVATNDRNHRPSDVEADEVVVYGKSSTGQPVVRLKSSGQLIVKGGGAAPGQVTIAAAGGVSVDAGTLQTITLNANGAAVTVTATGNIDLVPGPTGFVNAGLAAAVDFALKGTTAILGIVAFCTAINTATSTWNGSGKTPTDLNVWINAVNAAASGLSTSTAAWPATKIKVF